MVATLVGTPDPDDSLDIAWLVQLNAEQQDEALARLPPPLRAEFGALLRAMRQASPFVPLPHQVPPADDEWFAWALIGGRGCGKTAAVTHVMNEHAMGPPCLFGPIPHRMGIIAPTLGDASASIVHGDDGLVVINPQVRELTRKGGTVVLWPNGAEAKLFGVHTETDVDRLRAGGNRCLDLREEFAAWRYLGPGMAQADFGLRVGPHPRWIGASTPRPRPTVRALFKDPLVRVTPATTDDNPHLDAATRARLYERYGGTRLGLQELEGLLLDEVKGALWTQERLEATRVQPDEVPALDLVRTYVDPSWGTTNDECGIIVCGRGVPDRPTRNHPKPVPHLYVLADLSKRTTPTEWGLLAALGFIPPGILDLDRPLSAEEVEEVEPVEYFGQAPDKVVGEGNFQAEQVRLVMRTVSTLLRRRIRFGLTYASKGKRLRAEPVVGLFEQGRAHIVGTLPGLEWQLTNWVPPETVDGGDDAGDPEPPPEGEEDRPEASGWSPDRLDAMVFGGTDLILLCGTGASVEVAQGMIPPTTPGVQRRPPMPPKPGRIPLPRGRQGDLTRRQLGRRG